MPRQARVIVPDFPHHVTQRGNRNQTTFFSDSDKKAYISILINELRRARTVEIWAYCLMNNHVHFVAVPKTSDALADVFGTTHKKYSLMINRRNKWKGYLWQGRFGSCVMDEKHLHAAVRYVENNPVKAGIVQQAEQYPWSSASARVLGRKDPLLTLCYLDKEIRDWKSYLKKSDDERVQEIEKSAKTGRPCGDGLFVKKIEEILNQTISKRPRGRPQKIK